ncbi:MAG: peptide chain release factor N(5)-glutamine methyltransferase [Thiobacillus sp.]
MATSVADLLNAATARIAAALSLDLRDARLDARVLAAHVLNVEAAWLVAHDTDAVREVHQHTYENLVLRRIAGEPVAYLTGVREFYGRAFQVTPAVLIPRPDTELLIELALQRLPADQPLRVLDLGTGSGCIAISLAKERSCARITAVDRMAGALAVAQINAATHQASVEWLLGDWFSPLANRQFDLIVSNPPYIAENDPHLTQGDVRCEPTTALVSGTVGLDDIGRIIVEARAHLAPGGQLLLEHGYNQGAAVRAQLNAAGYRATESWRDLSGTPRVSGGVSE